MKGAGLSDRSSEDEVESALAGPPGSQEGFGELPSRGEASGRAATVAARAGELAATLSAWLDGEERRAARPPLAVHVLRDRQTVEGVLADLVEQRAPVRLTIGRQTLDGVLSELGAGALTVQAPARATEQTERFAVARVEIHGVIFLIRGALQLVAQGYRLGAPVQLGTLNRRAIRRIAVPAGRARLHWIGAEASAQELCGAAVLDYAVDGAKVSVGGGGERLPTAAGKFPALLELDGEQIACLAEVSGVGGASSSRGVRLHAPLGRRLLTAAYLKHRFPRLISRREADPEAVAELFRRSGYMDLRSGTRPPEAWFALPGAEALSRDVCYRARDGALLGHTSATRAYSRAWLGHQIATLRDHEESAACRHVIYLHIASFATLIDGEDTVMYGYFDRSKRWHQLFFHDFVRWVGDPREAVITELDRFERSEPEAPPPSAPPLAADTQVGEPLAHEVLLVTALIRAQLPALVADTMDIDPERLVSGALHPGYGGSRYTRQRQVLVLRVGGRLVGAALCELGSRELSLFNLFNMAFFFFRAGVEAPPVAAQLGLLGRVRALYAERGEHNPLIVAPPGVFDATAEPGTVLAETMGMIAKSGRALRQYESFLDYHFGRHAAGMR